MKDYYGEENVMGLVGDMDDLRECLNGLDYIKVIKGMKYYRKKDVDRYIKK